MALSKAFVIHIKAIRPCWYKGFYKLTTVYFLLSDLIDTDITICHIVSNTYWRHRDYHLLARSKHHCLHIVCPCKQALTRAQGYGQGY
jgi:hypothetical protein